MTGFPFDQLDVRCRFAPGGEQLSFVNRSCQVVVHVLSVSINTHLQQLYYVCVSMLMQVTEGVKNVIVYPSASDKTKNRGFAFIEYESHRMAAMARKKLISGRIQLWGHNVAVDWAEPEIEVDEDIMAGVRVSSGGQR